MSDPKCDNRGLWNIWAALHADSAFYDLDAFLHGESSLREIERDELGDISNKKLLHLQCHFGLDSLSLARMGAEVTGIDFSEKAIELARALAKEAELEARFIVAAVENLEAIAGETFDIVYTSYGVLAWLADLDLWARTIADHLKPDGVFYMVEFHPFLDLLADDGSAIAHSYFDDREGHLVTERQSYTGAGHDPIESRQWSHPLSEVVTALCDAGLALEFLHEFPFSPYPCPAYLKPLGKGRNSRYVVPRMEELVPLTYSAKARRLD